MTEGSVTGVQETSKETPTATFRAAVRVTLKRAILDPQGRAVEATLKRLGAGTVADVRIGKHIELTLSGERGAVEAQLQDLIARVLSNPVMEEASYTLTEVTGRETPERQKAGDETATAPHADV